MRPRVLIPLFPGTNCHEELSHAFSLAGANPKIATINELLARKVKLSDTDILAFAGGFSYGDHVRSGAIAATDLNSLRDELRLAKQKKIPMIGICNGFQILVEAGLLPGNGPIGRPTAILDQNLSARYEHRSEVTLRFQNPTGHVSIWLNLVNGTSFTLPVGHGEGRLVVKDSSPSIVVATYGSRVGGDISASPNGSVIAALSSPDGLVLGMMPHAERRVDCVYGGSQGLDIFRAGVYAVRS